MLRRFKFFPIAIVTFALAFLGVAGWVYFFLLQEPVRIEPEHAWEKHYFVTIDQAAEMANIAKLVDVPLKKDDAEIRVWRGFGYLLEGVRLRRADGVWSGSLIRADDRDGVRDARSTEIGPPRSGWDAFTRTIIDMGIMNLPDAAKAGCKPKMLDGMSYVVEINTNHTYRTYTYQENSCPESGRITEIADLIGIEFDTGTEKCKTTEWFACAKIRRDRSETK